eukprot:jgi/Picre1/30926/NNA_006285.t1
MNTRAQQLFPPPPPWYSSCHTDELAKKNHGGRSGYREPPPVPSAGEGVSSYQQFGEIFSLEDGMPGLQVSQEFERSEKDGSICVKEQLLLLHRALVGGLMGCWRLLMKDSTRMRGRWTRETLRDVLRHAIDEKRRILERLKLEEEKSAVEELINRVE